MKPPILLCNPVSGDIYEHLGEVADGHNFRNLTTGAEGVVKAEVARKFLKLSVHLNALAAENPALTTLISSLNLGLVDVTSKTS